MQTFSTATNLLRWNCISVACYWLFWSVMKSHFWHCAGWLGGEAGVFAHTSFVVSVEQKKLIVSRHTVCYHSARVDEHPEKIFHQLFAAWDQAQKTRWGPAGALKDDINGHGNRQTDRHPVCNAQVSISLCLSSVTRDGKQRAGQVYFIIPAVFMLHPLTSALPTLLVLLTNLA